MKHESTTMLVHRLVPDTSQRERVFNEIAEREREGYSFEDAPASLELLIARLLDGKQIPFSVQTYHVSMRGDGASDVCEASVKVLVRGAQYHTVSEGGGPISALDGALRLALECPFPELQHVRLEDYSVGLAGLRVGAGSRTRVLVVTADTKGYFTTIGVSPNVVKASLHALVDGMEYALLPRR